VQHAARLAVAFCGGRFGVTPTDRSGPGRGTLLLADISGYTAFLQAVGAAHAAEMKAGTFVPEAYPLLTSLLDGIVERIAPPFVLSKFEGDAVFAFAPDDEPQLRGLSVLACLTACDEAYRARVDQARDLMICTCDACSSIGGLELKFVLHHGDYIVQSIAGHQEVLGPDVTVAHLLLKNHVGELIGRSPYALFTESAAAHLEIPLDGARAIEERYEHYPTIRGLVLTLP
jgi:class 3 adenylate cyclase